MSFSRHPDHARIPHRDDPCIAPAMGTTGDGVRVCVQCAAEMAREGFYVDFDEQVDLQGCVSHV